MKIAFNFAVLCRLIVGLAVMLSATPTATAHNGGPLRSMVLTHTMPGMSHDCCPAKSPSAKDLICAKACADLLSPSLGILPGTLSVTGRRERPDHLIVPGQTVAPYGEAPPLKPPRALA